MVKRKREYAVQRRPMQYRRLTPLSTASSRAPAVAAIRARRAKKGRYSSNQVPRGFVGLAGDRKYVDTAEAVYACNTTGSITHISIVPTGTSVNTRDGKAFKVNSVQLRGYVTADTTTTTTLAWCALVWDYQPNKALPALTDIWDLVNGTAMIKRENNARFKILMYRRYPIMGNVTAPATGAEVYQLDEYHKLPNDCVALCTSADTTGVIGNRINGALYLCTGGSTAAGTADGNAVLFARANFTDL